MTEEYKFFDSTSDDIREYSAGDFANYWGSIYTSGLLFEQNTLALQVTANSSLTTKVGAGKALIKGHAYENTESLMMVHNPSSGGRIDRVVLRMDLGFNQRYIRLFVKEGTASAPPSLTRTEQIYELSLAQVKVRAGASSITASDITDERLNEEVCGPVVALVAAMAFSYPSDVPSDITNILNQVNKIPSIQQQIKDLQQTIFDNSLFKKTPELISVQPYGEKEVVGEGVLQFVTASPYSEVGEGSPNYRISVTIDETIFIDLAATFSNTTWYSGQSDSHTLGIPYKKGFKISSGQGSAAGYYFK